MLTAEFHLSISEIDEQMDLPLFDGFLRYRDFNPPAGALIKGVLEAFGDGRGTAGISYSGGSTSSSKSERESLSELVAIFGGMGGNVTSISGGD